MVQDTAKRITLKNDDDTKGLISAINTGLLNIGYPIEDTLEDGSTIVAVGTGVAGQCEFEVSDDLKIQYNMKSFEGDNILSIFSKGKGMGIDMEVSKIDAEFLNYLVSELA